VLVLDWGLAVATEGHRPTPNVSAAFNIAGTPAYMSPELAFGPMEAIGRHSDIYLLGAILYECITGKPPHAGKNARECLKAAARNQIVPTEKHGELVDIALQAMSTDPKKRPPTVQAFQEAIRSYQAHSESIALCERAEAGLVQAARSNNYQDYSRALFAFEEAVQLWSGNESAKTGVSRARLAYATCALAKSDFDLGLSLVSAEDPSHESVAQKLRESKAERDARQQRLARARRIMAGLAALVFVAVSVGVCVASYLAVKAKESEGKAVASAIAAKASEEQAKVSEEQAKKSEAKAIQKEQIATSEAERARKAEEEAKLRREEAIASAYTALIAMAAARIDENAFDQARQALDQCDERHRGWEWRRLAHVVAQGDVTQLALPSRAEALAVSSSGDLIATGSVDGIVRVWDRSRRMLVAEHDFGEKSRKVAAVAFHPQDERWLVVGLSDGPLNEGPLNEGLLNEGLEPLVAWNRATGEFRRPAVEHRHAGGVVQAVFAADGKSLLTASHDRTAKLWNWETLKPTTFAGHTGTVWSAALSADGKKVATASDDGTVRIWDVATGTQRRSKVGQRIPFAQHQGAVHAVVFLPDLAPAALRGPAAAPMDQPNEPTYQLASAGYDKRVLLWQTDELVPFDFQGLVSDRPVVETAYHELKGHTAAVRSLAVSLDGLRLASTAADHTIRIWQTQDSSTIRRGALIKELRGHAGPVYAAAFVPGDASSVVSTGYDDRLKLWNIDQYQEQQALPGLALRGHAGAVLSARYSPTGQSIVTASLDRTARTWNPQTATPQRTFREGHSYLASRAIFFPKTRRLLTAGGDGTARLWDLDRQAEERVLDRTGYRAAAAVSPDEKLILTGSSDVLRADSVRPHGAIVWNAETGEQVRALVDAHKAPVTCVAFSPAPEASLALTADDNGVFQLWNPVTGERIGPRIDQHASPIVAAEFARDGLSLVTADISGHVIRWNLANRAAIAKSQEFAHPAGVQSLGLTPDGKHLVTGGGDGRIRLFAVGSKEAIWIAEPLVASSGFVSTESLAVESIPAVAVAWDAIKGVAVAVAIDSLRRSAGAQTTGDVEEEYVRLFELDPAGKSFTEVTRAAAARASGPGDGPACLINLSEMGAVGWSVAIARDGSELITIGRDEARLFGRDGNELAAFRPHQDLTFAEFSHSGKLVVTASLDSSIRVWDAISGQANLTLDGHSAGPLGGHRGPVNCAAFSADDQRVFTGSEDGTVREWDLATMRAVRVIEADTRGITRLVISRDGQTLFTASRSGQAAIWDLAKPPEPLRRLTGHTGELLDLCLSPDEKWIVTASADNTARIWNASTGTEVLKLAGHASEVTGVAVLADKPGLRVLTGSSDKTAKLWAVTGLTSDAPVAKELLTLKGHSRELTCVAFAPDGRAALTSARDGLTIVWPATGSLPGGETAAK
jgi:WD40 repeat protein